MLRNPIRKKVQARLGCAYYNGTGVPVDKEASVEWYSKAAAQGHADSQYLMGSSFFFGTGVPVDKAAAVTWWRTRASHRSFIRKPKTRRVSRATWSARRTETKKGTSFFYFVFVFHFSFCCFVLFWFCLFFITKKGLCSSSASVAQKTNK